MSACVRTVCACAAMLAVTLFSGCGREELSTPAFSPAEMKSLEEKAGHGDAESEYLLGLAQQQGMGMPVNMTKAVEWFRRAAEHGHGHSEVLLGLSYRSGEGVPADPAEAAKWFRRAADRGRTDAQYYLAKLYQSGEGVSPDILESLKWLMLASQGPSRVKEANYEAGELKKTMTPHQTTEAQRRADAFRARP